MSDSRPWSDTPLLAREIGWTAVVAVGLLTILLGAWLRLIFPVWAHNPDLSHGFFTPILFVLLLRESRAQGPARFLAPTRLLWVVCTCLLGLSLVTLTFATLFAAAIDWTHSLVLFLAGCSLAGALGSLWLVGASRPVRLVPFNWIAAVAILLWVLSLPIPPGTYQKLTLTLQLWVSDRVLQSLHLLGIPAIQNGNIIELARTTVGVEEACSGVRSLLSCIYAGFFFSAAFVRRWISRVVIILLAPLLAIAMNYVRSLTLTLLANADVDIAGAWHDATGFAILGITALFLGALAMGLEKVEGRKTFTAPNIGGSPPVTIARSGTQILTAGYTAAACGIASFLFLSRPLPPTNTPVPDILAFLPQRSEGWSTATANGLIRFADILETDKLGQRSYVKKQPDGSVLQITFYLAYWKPGQAGVSVVATHTPDACWPGAGWAPQPTAVSQTELPLRDRELSRSEYRLFTNDQTSQHVWFWHSYNREVIPEFNPRRPLQLLNSVLTYGIREQGEQLFVRLSSNRPWEEFADEPLIAEVFAGLKPYGI